MSEPIDELAPIDPVLGAHIDAEKARRGMSPAIDARIGARLETTLALGAGALRTAGPLHPTTQVAGGAGAAAKIGAGAGVSLSLGKALVSGVLVAAVAGSAGVWVGRQTARPEIVTRIVERRVEVRVAEHSAQPVASPAHSLAEATVSAHPAAPTVVTPRATPGVAAAADQQPTRGESRGDLVVEAGLLERARAALARSRAEDALAAVAEHRRRFARGDLAEERDALEVRALALAGRDADAVRAATAFERHYPASLMRRVVRDALPHDGEPSAAP